MIDNRIRTKLRRASSLWMHAQDVADHERLVDRRRRFRVGSDDYVLDVDRSTVLVIAPFPALAASTSSVFLFFSVCSHFVFFFATGFSLLPVSSLSDVEILAFVCIFRQRPMAFLLPGNPYHPCHFATSCYQYNKKSLVVGYLSFCDSLSPALFSLVVGFLPFFNSVSLLLGVWMAQRRLLSCPLAFLPAHFESLWVSSGWP